MRVFLSLGVGDRAMLDDVRPVVLVAVAGCIEPSLVPCGEQACPIGTLCTPSGCATVEAVAACSAGGAGDPCMAGDITRGACRDGACRAVVCGDGLLELDEVCDDGNTASGDACSASCSSTEQCGNNVVDLAQGERCDEGVPGLSGDGCSSTCQLETGSWANITAVGLSPRAGVAMAYDAEAKQVVLFGGATGVGPIGQTWLWSGTSWTRADPITSPPARRGAAMAHDPVRGEIILFGGLGQQGLLADTWSWTRGNWEQRTPAMSPSPRSDHAMTWFPGKDMVVLHGGSSNQDSWSWNGTSWTLEQTQLYPLGGQNNPIWHPAMASWSSGPVLYGSTGEQFGETFFGDSNLYFAGQGLTIGTPNAIDGVHLASNGTEVVLFGGYNGSIRPINETWVLPPASDWTQITTTVRPPARVQSAIAYDPERMNYVLFGGFSETSTLLGDTWTYASSTWSPRTLVPPAPPPSGTVTCAHDELAGRIVLWDPGSGQTWQWSAGRDWRPLFSGLPAPDRGNGQQLVYDTVRARIVMFGRALFPFDAMETWELARTTDIAGNLLDTWSQVTTSTVPPQHIDHAMAFDAARGKVVMIGTGSTWTYDGIDWTEHAIAGPPPRIRGAMAYDARRQRVVMFGGAYGPGLLADTWEWDGTSWTERTPTTSPSARMHHTLVYDPIRERVVLVGGETYTSGLIGDTWEWDGATWTLVGLATVTPVRGGHCAAYDTINRQLILFGGYDFLQTPTAETWALRYASPSRPTERCRVATEDLDGDGLSGCGDPDCWGRCNPQCVPGLPCAPTANRCGDGTCNISLEDEFICPEDC